MHHMKTQLLGRKNHLAHPHLRKYDHEATGRLKHGYDGCHFLFAGIQQGLAVVLQLLRIFFRMV